MSEAAIKAEALREAADAWNWSAWSDVLDLRALGLNSLPTAQSVGDWLRARADALGVSDE